ncbi:MAG: transglycosylase SLT domain-containing protein [Candidatus Woesearchaeota archaeon]
MAIKWCTGAAFALLFSTFNNPDVPNKILSQSNLVKGKTKACVSDYDCLFCLDKPATRNNAFEKQASFGEYLSIQTEINVYPYNKPANTRLERIKRLELEGFPEYNALLPKIVKMADESGVPEKLLAIIALVESNGKGGRRYEYGLEEKYINKALDENPKYMQLFNKLRMANPALTLEEYKKQLATSVGPWQVVYSTSVWLGFQGSIEELEKPEVNLYWAAQLLKKQSRETGYELFRALRAYNAGTPDSEPADGYLERAEKFLRLLEEKIERSD